MRVSEGKIVLGERNSGVRQSGALSLSAAALVNQKLFVSFKKIFRASYIISPNTTKYTNTVLTPVECGLFFVYVCNAAFTEAMKTNNIVGYQSLTMRNNRK